MALKPTDFDSGHDRPPVRYYHPAVRKLLMLFLIVLLPLRGWAVDGMALQTGRGDSVTVVVAHPTESPMPGDCPMVSHADPSQDALASPASDHQGCQSCELCMPLAALTAPDSVLPIVVPNAAPIAPMCTFASAESARFSKPPIS